MKAKLEDTELELKTLQEANSIYVAEVWEDIRPVVARVNREDYEPGKKAKDVLWRACNSFNEHKNRAKIPDPK